MANDLAYSYHNDPKPRQYTEKQQYVLDNVVSLHKGNAIEAAKAAGYTNPRRAVDSLKKELIEIAESILATNAISAAMLFGRVIESDDPIPFVKEKMEAAKEILSHTNPKAHKVELGGEAKIGLFILPPKGQKQVQEVEGEVIHES